jgi:hypothetical protein
MLPEAAGPTSLDNNGGQMKECTAYNKPCEDQDCQECCPHDDRDHGICLDCEHEEDPGAAADWYRDQMEDR